MEEPAFINRASSPLQAEAIAALQGLERAASMGMTNVILETDAANLGRAISSSEWDQSLEGGPFKSIKKFMVENFESCKIIVCPRACNRAADMLAAHGVCAVPNGERMFWCDAPSFVSELNSGDLPGVSNASYCFKKNPAHLNLC